MAMNDPFASPPANRRSYRKSAPNLNAPLPPLPPDELEFEPGQLNPHVPERPYTSPFDDPIFQSRHSLASDDYDDIHNAQLDQDPFIDDDAIPLRPQYQQHDYDDYDDPDYPRSLNAPLPPPPQPPLPPPPTSHRHRSPSPRRRKTPFFSFQTPWVTYGLTTIQVVIFLVELIKAGILTGSPIEIHPTFNPMIGPSPYVLINMGARFVPCMRTQQGVQNNNETILWPCANATTTLAECSLSQLCGFNGVPNPVLGGVLEGEGAQVPNQWFRFVLPIFLHAGIVHVGFNMLLQVLLGGDIEKIIGHVRFFFVYFASGIFGFVCGGNFAPAGISSTGASGALFGIIAILLLDLLYHWSERPSPLKDLMFIILDIVISFVLGLLPGVDNFSHIGGFIMGLLLGIFLLRSPKWVTGESRVKLPIGGESRHGDAEVISSRDLGTTPPRPGIRKAPTNKFSPLPPLPLPGQLGDGAPPLASDTPTNISGIAKDVSNPLAARKTTVTLPKTLRHWIWWGVRAAALVAAIVFFVVSIKSFYSHHQTECHWCRYLSCLPVNGWCEIGDLTFSSQ